ncbi:unnamed protein product [Cyclocybe aegerita]|uniref:Aminoglycoside phosphotransferase domain-containing protein n=1 Tax=Cyclocybe aegerita TaxID=1973307 RepID=A0A8S0VQG3_CYCAE|nr:unnamed protein product [Cyclocybe aegerita]
MENGYQRLNASALRALAKAFEADPAGDLEDALRDLSMSYPRLRDRVDKRRVKLAAGNKNKQVDCSVYVQPPISQPRLSFPPDLLSSLSSGITTTHIISSLAPQVLATLGISHHDYGGSEIAQVLFRVFSNKEPLALSGQRAIVALSEEVVVKLVRNSSSDELTLLHFLQEHVPTVAAPRPMGFMLVGTISCMFMSRFHGETLKDRWPMMPTREKYAVRLLLNRMLSDLRKVHLPSGSPMGSLSSKQVCKDCRRDLRISSDPIHTEEEFNDFLTHSRTSRASLGYRKWVQSMMRRDHRILLTHGDLHPGNVIISINGAELTLGIIDWEMGGFYPEYWEVLKAMNTRSIDDASDWWEWLPECIMGYDNEILVDRLVESTLL